MVLLNTCVYKADNKLFILPHELTPKVRRGHDYNLGGVGRGEASVIALG